jgi:hypothetical protein
MGKLSDYLAEKGSGLAIKLPGHPMLITVAQLVETINLRAFTVDQYEMTDAG